MANQFTAQEIDTKRAVALYNKGMTLDEVAMEMGTTKRVLWIRLRRIGYKARKAAKRNQKGEMNDSWKGDKAGYDAFHIRVKKLRGRPMICVRCGTKKAKRYEWANLTRDYKNPYDYIRLCASCHRKMDSAINNIRNAKTF